MDDIQAINRLKHGDIGGLEDLIDRYQGKAARAAYLITHDVSMAEDVVQDTFIHLFNRIHSFDTHRPFEPYLLRSVINRALNTLQKERKQIQMDDGEGGILVENLLGQANQVEGEVEFNQLKQEIFNALVRLSPHQRAVIVQRYYLGMSEKEMAQDLCIAHGTVKWLLSEARNRLRLLLNKQRSLE